MSDKPTITPWFAPKRYGYGASLPIRWQGWLLLIGYLIAMIAALPLMLALLPKPQAVLAAATVSVLLTAVFVLIVRDRTEGGWRWRWGKD